jgi:choice-of-anchor B domain-containing protein
MILLRYLTLCLFISSWVQAQQNMQFLGHLPFPVKINDIWGYQHSSGSEYALVCSEVSLYIVDITAPNQPSLVFEIAGDTSAWRDVKTYNDFAYVVNEKSGGLLIIDLSNLPNSAPFQYITEIDTFNYQTAHNLFIDENGVAYLLGSNIANSGAFMLNINTPNRFEPQFLGLYDDQYVHDAYARGDTLYTSEINNGTFSVVDVSDKQNPIILARQSTSRRYTHNCWLSDDGNYLITTDEKPGAFVDIYNINNLNNIKLLDQYQNSPRDSVIPHNTFFLGNYIFTSYYRNGLTLVDATIKDNLVEIGSYDTSPFSSDRGFEGNWGVYPYLPSGHIIASDREEGLFILDPNYTRASYLTGTVFDTLNNQALGNAVIAFIGTDYLKYATFNGSYKIGVADSGFYDLRMTHPNCQTVIESGLLMETAIEKILNIETNCDFNTTILEFNNSEEILLSADPQSDLILINVASKDILHAIEIFNASGSMVYSIETHAKRLSIKHHQNLPSGMYIVRFVFQDRSISRKIMRY